MFKPTVIIALLCVSSSVFAASLEEKLRGALNTKGSNPSSLSQTDATGGVKEALAKGVEQAISQLGKPDGFFRDQAVKILVPKKLRKVTDLAKKLGYQQQVDSFELAMNRGAEQAVPAASSILGDAVRAMSVKDAVSLVRGGDSAATDYFRQSSEQKLYDAFLPIVAKQTANTGVSQKYKALTGSVSSNPLGATLLSGDNKSADLDGYVTNKAIDGLFQVIAAKEAEIRSNPAAQTTSLLRKVFGK
jgi:Protein of unknown function (DUF4197)